MATFVDISIVCCLVASSILSLDFPTMSPATLILPKNSNTPEYFCLNKISSAINVPTLNL